MTPITEYNTKEEYIRLLLQGPSGSIKTTTACRFPSPYIVDFDVNLGGPLRWLKSHNLPLPMGYDRVDVDEKGEVVPPLARWMRLETLVANVPPEVGTIVFDSATGLTQSLMDETKRLQPSLKDERQLYKFFLAAGFQFLTKLKQANKHVILIAHEKIEQDEMTGIRQYRVAWPGQLGDYIGAFFTNVWRCEVEREGIPPKYRYIVRTMQDAQNYGLKNDLELPPTFVFDWNIIQAKLNA